MADNYIMYPSTKQSLSAELKRAFAAYQAGEMTNSEFAKLLKSWRHNCDFMMAGQTLDLGVVRYLGKRRSSVIQKLLEQ